MAGPSPSAAFLNARQVVREGAVARTQRRLHVSPDVMPAISGIAGDQLRPALAEIDPRQAGWVAVVAGTLIARNCERLTTAAGDLPPEPSFTAGLAWAALLTAVVGDKLLDADGTRNGRPFIPGEASLDARRRAAELAGEPADARDLAGMRFAAYVLAEIDEGLPRLDALQAGYALVTFAVWIAGHADRISGPLGGRRGLMRRTEIDAEPALAGCSFTAGLLARVGELLIARAGAA